MTTVARQVPGFRRGTLAELRERLAARNGEQVWSPIALLGVTLLAAVLYLWNLGASGFANEYYSAAALAASRSWSALFFGSFDAANFITVDKPPVAIWAMGLSVRLFGLNSWAILLPQALAGVASVALLFLAVRRSFGSPAATIAAVTLALTPAAALMFRFNNPDAMLTLLLVAAAYALLRSLERGSYRWVALAGAFVGLAFLTKYLQAYIVLPGFALVYGFSASATLRRRLGGLAVAATSVVVTSGWWVAIVQLLPASLRPFIGGSTNGSPLDLIFGYDGLGRIFGASAGGGFGGGGFGGTAGFFRLFNSEFYGQIAWLIPPAIAALLLGLFLRRWAHPTDRGLAGYLLWGTWFVVTALVFSFMSGTIHSYYAVALAPAIAALVGAGAVDLWRLRAGRVWIGGIGAGIAAVATAWWGGQLLGRTPTFAPQLGAVAVGIAVLAAAVLAAGSLPRLRRSARRVLPAAAALGLSAALLAPAVSSLATATRAITGSDPHPGPADAVGTFGGGGQGPALAFAGAAPLGGPASTGVQSGATDSANAISSLAAYLTAHQGSATWIVAVSGASEAASLELQTGLPVMAMGGFTGSDPTPTLAQLQSYVASGQLRYVLIGGMGGGRGGDTSSAVSTWVTSTCTAVSDAGTSGGTLYDCQGAVS